MSMTTLSLIIRNVTMTDCRQARKGDILIENGVIAKIGGHPAGSRVVDGTGLTLMPSFVDLHTHFRDPGFTHKEDMESGSRAAVHGGYTFVNLMPNTAPVCSGAGTLRYVLDKAEALGLCGVHQTLSITKDFDGKTLDHWDAPDGGVRWLSDDGNGVESTAVILAAMKKARELGLGLMLHEEDRALTPVDSCLSEELPTCRDVELAVHTGCRVHFCHVSTAAAMDFVLAGKRRSRAITCEVTPHHLALNDTNGGKVAPPLRSEEDRLYLIECVKNGFVDAIATDHAPHTPAEKAAGANGFTGLDLSFATCYTTLVREHGLPLQELSRMMSCTPAGLMGLPSALIGDGLPANLVLLDLETPFVAGPEHIFSKSKNSPMLGKTLYGTVLMTLKDGEIVYEKAD